MFPAKFDRYIEVFGGGGWVLFGRPPDHKGMEVYNDFNSNLANLFYCVKNRTWALLRELGFLPLNSRDEFTVIRDFIDKKSFDDSYLKTELELAEHNLPPPEFEEIKAIMLENAEVTDIKRAAAFFKLIRYSYGSGCTSYSGGASTTVNRTPCKASKRPPFPFQANVPAASFKAGKETLIFLPDKLFIMQKNKVGALSYSDILSSAHTTRFQESGKVPKDTQVVGQTWKYINKSGGPDKRFKENRQIPICLYGELELTSTSGLNTVIMFSNPNI